MAEYVFTRFEEACERYPTHPALVYLGRPYSFAALHDAISRFATALSAIGVQSHDRALIYLPNCVQWVIGYFALQKIGAVPVPVSPAYTAHEIGAMARDSGATLALCQDTNFGYVAGLRDKTPIEKIVVTNLADVLPLARRAFGFLFDKVPRGRVGRGEGIYSFRALLAGHPPRPPHVEIDPDRHLAYILYTGGTTGLPKGVHNTHRSMVSYVADLADRLSGTLRPNQDVLVLVNPLSHVMAKGMFMALGLNSGCTTVVMPEPQVDAILAAVQRHRVTMLLGVPALYRMILENERQHMYDLSSLRLCWSGGDALPREVYRRFEERCGVKIRQVYGSTEVGFVSMSDGDHDPASGCLGRLLPSRRARVVDPATCESVPEGETGELLVTSEHILKEYWNNPAETERCFVELEGEVWYRMGDFVRLDGDQLFYVDRRADLINSMGYRVSASEVETVLQDHPAVVEACVVGVPDTQAGERIKAFVVLKSDARGISSAELMRWCRERLAHYKVPRYVEFRDMLPKSKVGKLLRREIRGEERRRLGVRNRSRQQPG